MPSEELGGTLIRKREPEKLGKYAIQRLLATGGMGEVFLAKQEGPAGFSKLVVIKRVLSHLAREPQFIQMFLDEARLAAILAHPNIVQIYELGEDAGTWFIAMEFLDGRSLRAVREKLSALGQAMDPVQAARMVSQALDGLHYAHTLVNEDRQPLNIVHRDVSPDNIFVCFNGAVKVLDFGIAKAANAITTTKTGMVKGKAAFMPPEQLLAQPLDGRTDVYAAGVVLYHLLSGRRPFEAPSDAALIHKILTAPPDPLKPLAPHVPDALCAMVMKSLAKTPANRYQSAAEFSATLERFVAASGVPNTNARTAAWMTQLFDTDTPAAARASAAALPQSAPLRAELPAPLPVTDMPVASSGFTPGPTQPMPLDAVAAEPLSTFVRESGLFEEPLPPTGLDPMDKAPSHGGARDETRFEKAALTTLADAESQHIGPASNAPISDVLELARPVAVAPPPEEAPPQPPATRPGRSLAPLFAVVVLAALGLGGYFVAYPRYLAGRTTKMSVPDVVFVSEPAGATLRIGDEEVGVTPWAASNAWVGTVPWELSAPGYQKRKGTFKGGEPVRFDVKLQKK